MCLRTLVRPPARSFENGRCALQLGRASGPAWSSGTRPWSSAATGVKVRMLAMRPRPETVFRAGHPFAFFIRDTSSGVILFEGRLLQTPS